MASAESAKPALPPEKGSKRQMAAIEKPRELRAWGIWRDICPREQTVNIIKLRRADRGKPVRVR